MARFITTDIRAKFKAGDDVILKTTCENVSMDSALKVGGKYKILSGPHKFTDNGGFKRTHEWHLFYRLVGNERGTNVPQDALELADKDMFDDLGPVGMPT